MPLPLEEQTEKVLETLSAQAAARNLRLADYLQLFADAGQVAGVEPSLVEFDSLLEQVSAGLSLLPALPVDFSRADIYAEHD